MAQCKHHLVCGREAAFEDGCCILHTTESKDAEAFGEVFRAHWAEKGENFGRMVFPPGSDNFFWEAMFEGRADFRGAVFEGGGSFSKATFEGRADFRGAVFKKVANFKEATFKKVDFGEATFKTALFSGARFFGGETASEEGADFSKATFEEASFEEAAFEGGVDFGEAAFEGGADFSRAVFKKVANFKEATFKKADFGEATFKIVLFGGATFDRVNFDGVTLEEADFNEATFSGQALFGRQSLKAAGDSSPEMDFRNVILDPLDALSFRNVDLSRSRLLGTDVREIELTGVRWARRPNRRWKQWKIGGNYAYDELYHEEQRHEDPEHRVPWSELERLYRELKQNYEDRRDYGRAGNFHYREKEMRRRNPLTPASHKALLGVYWVLSGYGERVWPAALWFLFIIAASAFLYLQIGIAPAGGGAPLDWGWQITSNWRGLGEALVYSARTSFLLNPEDFELTSVGAKIVNLVQTVISPIVLGLMALAIRQRLKR